MAETGGRDRGHELLRKGGRAFQGVGGILSKLLFSSFQDSLVHVSSLILNFEENKNKSGSKWKKEARISSWASVSKQCRPPPGARSTESDRSLISQASAVNLFQYWTGRESRCAALKLWYCYRYCEASSPPTSAPRPRLLPVLFTWNVYKTQSCYIQSACVLTLLSYLLFSRDAGTEIRTI